MPADYAFSLLLLLLLWSLAGELFFTDWNNMPLETRMKNWDRRFKLLTAYPQVRSCTLCCQRL
jgi:hypothetical protein